jgi:hypothetical protein
MAITQVQANKAQIGGVNPVSDDGFAYHVLGGVWLIVGSGTPQTTTLKDAPKGSIYVDSGAGNMYFQTAVADASASALVTRAS